MAEWGWRTPRQIEDPKLRSVIQSLERYLIVRHQDDTGSLDALAGFAGEVTAAFPAYAAFLQWYAIYPTNHNVLVGLPEGGGSSIQVVTSNYGVTPEGAPYQTAFGEPAAAEDRAWIGFTPAGVPYLVRVGGPEWPEPPPFTPPTLG